MFSRMKNAQAAIEHSKLLGKEDYVKNAVNNI